jgi:hypothetical protein
LFDSLNQAAGVSPPTLTIHVGDTDTYKVVNVSNGQRRETMRAVIRSLETFYDCRIDLRILNPAANEASLYSIARPPKIVKGNDFALDIAHTDIVAGQRSPILLHEVLPDGHFRATQLQTDRYTIRLSVFNDDKILSEATYRLWIDQGTLRLTPALP